MEKSDDKFRVNRKKLYLTYAGLQPGSLTCTEIIEHLQRLGNIIKWVIGEEIAPSSGLVHFHVFAVFDKKLDIKQRDRLLVKGLGVNVRKLGKGKDDMQRCYEYCIKDCKYVQSGGWEFFASSDNFIKKKADFEAWKQFRQSQSLADPFPFTLPKGEVIEADYPSFSKQHHFWIHGASNSGKTTWLNEAFRGKKIYVRNNDGQYPYDSYNGERIIAFDDIVPRLDELLYMSNTFHIPTRVYGSTRYTPRYLELGQSRILVVLSNKHPKECYVKDDQQSSILRYEAFMNRFVIYEF